MKRVIAPALCVVLLAGCGSKEISCADEATLSTLTSLVKESIEEQVKKDFDENAKAKGLQWDASRLRALLGSVVISFVDVRTTKKDPSSTKRFCEAELKAYVPQELLEVANKVRAVAGYEDMASHARALDVKFEAGSVADEVEYAAQPTDDGKKVYVSSARQSKPITFLTEVISANLIKPMIDAAETQKVKAQEDERARQTVLDKEKQELAKEQEQLRLEKARGGIKDANDQINVVWNAATPEFRKAMLSEQRIWLKEREVDCKMKATTVAEEVSAIDREIIRLSCEAEMTVARTSYLKDKVAAP